MSSSSSPSTPAAASSSSNANASALQIALAHLQGALTYTESTNIETNRKLWNTYAKSYKEKRDASASGSSAQCEGGGGADGRPSDWVLEMASHVSRDASQLHFLGDEWSDDRSLTQCLDEFLFPLIGVNHLTASTWLESASIGDGLSYLPSPAFATPAVPSTELVVAEIGVGGGRVASRVYGHVKHLYCFDIAEEMLKQAQESIAQLHAQNLASTADASAIAASASPATLPSNISFHLLSSAPSFPPKLLGSCDVVYSFDVLPHVDLHTIYGYFKTVRTILKPNPTEGDRSRPRPRVFLHTANLCAPLGFERFSKQSRYTAGGFYFVSPDIIHQLAAQTGYRIIQQSRCAPTTPACGAASTSTDEFQAARDERSKNLYYQRDFLFVMEVI
jgi:SAM-dependent methyltransferase